MKLRFLIILSIVLLIALVLFFHHQPSQTPSQRANSVSTASAPSAAPTMAMQNAKQTTTTPTKSSTPDPVMEYVQKIKADPQYDWKQPINFYGRVVDQSNTVVTEATINFEWNDISPTGTSKDSTTSDGNGFFSLKNRTGKRLYIDISKDGYYSIRNATYEYANPADGLFKPDPMNPVVFHLRKKGLGVDLITSQNGMDTSLRILPPTNGTPVSLDFFTQKVGNNGQLKIEGWKEVKDFKTGQDNWGFRLTVPDGGLIEENDEFPFEAPEDEYQSVWEWHFKDGAPDWQGGINKKFYIKFGNPARYGRITVQTGAFRPAVYLEYAINPTGSRNLEPK